MRYACIDRRRNQYPVRMMCRLLEVSRSGYYAWRVRPESQRVKTDRQLLKRIRQIHADSDGVYGAVKIAAELNEEGYPCGRAQGSPIDAYCGTQRVVRSGLLR